MKRPTIFRTVVLLTGVCVAYWQAPKLIELVDKVRGGMSPAAALAGLTGKGQPSPANEISLEQLRSVLSGAGAGQAISGAKPGGDVVVFSPNGAALTEAQKQALIEKANRMRPAGSGAAPDRISLPPGLSPPARPVAGEDDQPDEPAEAPEQHPEETPKEPEPESTPNASVDDLASATDLEELSTAALGGEPVGIHDELREMLHEITPPNHNTSYLTRRASRVAWRNPSLPRGPRPAFIIGPPGSGVAP